MAPNVVGAAEFSGYAVLTTDYVYRGVTMSDGHAAAQLGGDISFDNGIYFGAWVSTIDIDNLPFSKRDAELDYYLGYAHEIGSQWSAGANVVAYTFPGAEGQSDYDYFEYSLTSNYADRLWFEYSYSPDYYHTGESTNNFAIYSEWPIIGNSTIGAGIGFYDLSRPAGSDYTYWQIGVTRPVGNVDIDLRFFDTSDYVRFVSTPERAEERVALSVRINF